MNLRSRAVGSVLGLALGDALGAPFRSKGPNTTAHPIPAFELSWGVLPPGTTTDATAMALNLAKSLSARNGLDPEDLIERHLAWFRTDPPGMEPLARRVLRRVDAGVPAVEAARQVWEERGSEAAAGNGSVAYCAPLGVAYANRPVELHGLAPSLSALTHHDQRCRTAVLAITLVTAALVRGEPTQSAVAGGLAAAEPLEGGEELEYLVEAVGKGRPIDGPDRGFCLFAAAAGLQAVSRGGGVRAELLRVVALGGDTTRNTAVAGALLGAAAGREGLPPEWVGRLVAAGAIGEAAEGLVPLAAATA